MKKIILLLLFTTCFLYNGYGQSYQQIVDSVVSETRKDFPEVGLVIGVYHDKKTNYYSYGTRTVNGNKKLDSTSIFEIGSATKTFTALLLAQEIQKNKINLHDFIDEYIPDSIKLPCSLTNRVKLTDLASHQSGLPNLSNDKYFSELLKRDPTNPFRFVDKQYLYNILANTDSLNGYRQYQYNNYAFSLLGELLAEVEKEKFTELLEKSILLPLRMSSTSFEIPNNGNIAGLYNQDGYPQVYMIIDAANPAGGLKSNAVDLIKYLKAHLYNEEISDAVLLTQRTYYEDEKKKIGLGWEIKNGYFQKDGDTFGNSSLIRYSPENEIAIVVLSNHQNGQLVRDLTNGIYERLID